jgi:isoleucyl-tRNA synthetase
MDFDADVPPPADLYAEGGDQHRGWFMSSLLCSIGMHNRAPFKSVATFGWTLDEKGRALSKSLGNFIDPVAIMDTLGGDIVRLWVASVDFREDVVASQPLLKRLAEEIYRKLRNTFRFLLGALSETDPSTGLAHDFDPRPMADGGDAVPFEQMQPIDQYILARTAELTAKIRNAYGVPKDAGEALDVDDEKSVNAFEFHRVYHLLNEFLNSELSAFYLDVLKDRLYTYPIKFKPGNAEQQSLYLARRSAQTAIYKITDALARLTAPILSFTADEVYQSLPHTHGSVHLTLFPTPEELATTNSVPLDDWDLLLSMRGTALQSLEAARNQKLIGKALEASVTIRIGNLGLPNFELLHKAFDAYKSSLPELLNVSAVTVVHSAESGDAGIPSATAEIATGTKCDRCWRHVPDVGQQEKYPTVCHRCAEALDAIDFPPYATT